MGLCGSVPEPVVAEMDTGKGDSVILERKGDSDAASLERQQGDSLIMSSLAQDLWSPGEPIVRPPNLSATQRIEAGCGDDAVVIDYGYCSLQGRNPRPPHKPNQDSLIVQGEIGDSTDTAILGVFDGHGPYGEHASHYCRMHIVRCLASQPEWRGDLSTSFNRCFETLQRDFGSEETRRRGVDAMVSGTTAMVCLVDRSGITAANVGDSRSILAIVGDDGDVECVDLSQDHKPSREDERRRVEQSSAVLLSERQVRGSGDHSKTYVCRERGGNIVYGVLFTRSVGDLDAHAHLGVSTQPEIERRPLPPGRCFLIIASDGLWDHMSSREVAEFAARVDDPQTAAASLTERAKDLWDMHDQDLRRDDITVVVARLDPRTQVAAAQPSAEAEEAAEEAEDAAGKVAAEEAEPAAAEGTTSRPTSDASAAGQEEAVPAVVEAAGAGADAGQSDEASQGGARA